MRNRLSVINLVIGVIVISFMVTYFLENGLSNKKVAFFDFNEVYSESNLKTELEKDLERVVTSRNSELDSLNITLTYLLDKSKNEGLSEGESDEFEYKKAKFYNLQEKYSLENQNLKSQFFQKIKLMINKKAVDFAKLNEYDLLFSANGDGAIMYGEDDINVTNEFINYVNQN